MPAERIAAAVDVHAAGMFDGNGAPGAVAFRPVRSQPAPSGGPARLAKQAGVVLHEKVAGVVEEADAVPTVRLLVVTGADELRVTTVAPEVEDRHDPPCSSRRSGTVSEVHVELGPGVADLPQRVGEAALTVELTIDFEHDATKDAVVFAGAAEPSLG